MGWIWIKLISGLIFVLVPGFTLKENFKNHPFLTVLSLSLGLFLLFLSLKPLVETKSSLTKIEAEMQNIKARFEQELILKTNTENNNFLAEKKLLFEEELLSKEKKRLDQKKIGREKHENNKEKRITPLEKITSSLNISESSAIEILKKVSRMISKLQKLIEPLADSTFDSSEKKSIIKFIIKEIFLSPKVIVQSSLNGTKIISRTAKDYFQYLLDISSKKNIKTKMFFGKKMIISSTFLNDKKEMIFEVIMDESFEICRGKKCKKNVTKKYIRVKLKKDNTVVVEKIYIKNT